MKESLNRNIRCCTVERSHCVGALAISLVRADESGGFDARSITISLWGLVNSYSSNSSLSFQLKLKTLVGLGQ